MLKPGHNCWCIDDAQRASVIVDTAAYFSAFAEACRAAQRQILILGWDFDRHERLYRDDIKRDLPDELGAFLVALVKRRKDLKVYLLSWDFNMIYAAERELLPAVRLRMQAPPRFHFRLDAKHPAGASHHQKVVVIDDRVAFVGGIDLSRWRWDTPEHKPGDPRRIDPNGKYYPPFHDMMMLVEGPVARRLGDLARERWQRARGWKIAPVKDVESSPWPTSVKARFDTVPVAIARTEPPYAGHDAVQEVKQLYLDGIRSARRFIYIENQYVSAKVLTDALCERLAEPDGPEVILVLPQQTGGWLEQITMDVLRGRLVARMKQADEHNRLRVYYPFQPGLGRDCISVHSKLLIVDDKLLRIGSSNASNRSMGMDTECDLAVEAEEDGIKATIRGLRHQLLAEHLNCEPARLAAVEGEQASLIGVIESLLGEGRSLRALDCSIPKEVDDMVPDSVLIDPPEPLSLDYFVTEYVPEDRRAGGRKRLIAFLAVLITLLALAAMWRWTPLQDWLSPDRLGKLLLTLPSPTGRSLAAVAAVVVASLLMTPLTVVAVLAGLVFEGWVGFAHVFTGALLASAIGFIGGGFLSRGAIDRLSGSRFAQLSKRLAKRGTLAVAILRLIPIAPFTVFNLVAGASHLGFFQFIMGSALGLAPGLAAITLFSSTLWAAVRMPSWSNVSFALGVGGALATFVLWAKRWLRSG